MNNRSLLLFLLAAALISSEAGAQEIITTKKLGKMAPAVFKSLDEVNALVFQPKSYERVVNPKLPDSLSSLMMLTREESIEMRKKRAKFNPYTVFDKTIELRNGDIFIGFSTSWIRLSSYYKYNRDGSSAADFRKKVNQNMLGKNMIGYSPQFELLEDVNNAGRELINADTAFIYDSKLKYAFKDTSENYGSMVVHLVKFDLGYVSLRYYYPLEQRDRVLSEINDTWGIIQFKPDLEFTHPDHTGRIPPSTEPDLYFGKFSFLNDPEQVKREREEYEHRKLKEQANSVVSEAIRMAQSRKFDQAREKLTEALKTDSDNVMAYRTLLLISMDEKNADESRRYWNKLAQKDPGNKETWFLKGLMEKRYNELDSARETFEMIIREKDSLHFRSFLELAFIAVIQGKKDVADLHFNRALGIFKSEGEKSVRKEAHRLLGINDLFKVRLAYARFLNTNSEFEKSKALLQQTLKDQEIADDAKTKGERQRIYGKLTPRNLGELHFMLAMCYSKLRDKPNSILHLKKARSHGKDIPEQLEEFLD